MKAERRDYPVGASPETMWPIFTAAELQSSGHLLVEDGNHGEYRPRSEEFTDDGVAFIRAADMDGGRILFDSASCINEAAMKRIRKGIGSGGDVLISHKGTVGKVSFAPTDCPAFVCSPQTTFWRSLDQNIIDRRFLYYYLCSDDFSCQLDSRKGETDMADYVSLTAQRTLKVMLPHIQVQRAIAHILGTLDDKIELNRRMNQTLEAMARALFKSWFVDFDPVRARAEGHTPPGLNPATAALFPDSFGDSEFGEIPKGWRVGSVYEIADVIYGAPFASSKFNTDSVGAPLIRIRDLANESPCVWTSEVHPKGYIVQAGDIVVGMDGEFRAYIWGGSASWLNQRLCVFQPRRGSSAAFVWNSITKPLADVEATETATTVIHLGKSDIDRFSAVLPAPPVLNVFNQLSQPWYDCIVSAKQESRTLAALRDALLPKLISGELRVIEAKRFVEGATQ